MLIRYQIHARYNAFGHGRKPMCILTRLLIRRASLYKTTANRRESSSRQICVDEEESVGKMV